MDTNTLDNQILTLLETSAIVPLLKSFVRVSLPSLDDEYKSNILKALEKEHKKLLALKKKEEKIIEKYRKVMAKLSKHSAQIAA